MLLTPPQLARTFKRPSVVLRNAVRSAPRIAHGACGLLSCLTEVSVPQLWYV
jgi:hypothetical protein